MYARGVSFHLKPGRSTEFTPTLEKDVIPVLRKQKGFQDEITLVAPGGADKVGISVWDLKENAETYARSMYSGVLKALEQVLALMVSTILALVARTRTPHGAVVDGLPLIDVDSPTVVTVTRRVLGIVVSAGARFWHVEGVPAAIHGRTRAASDARNMMRSDHYNRSRGRGQASRGLGLGDGSRGRARPPML